MLYCDEAFRVRLEMHINKLGKNINALLQQRNLENLKKKNTLNTSIGRVFKINI